MAKLKQNQFYCVSCQKRITIKDKDDIRIAVYPLKNRIKMPAMRSVCPECDTNLTKFQKVAKTQQLIDKYGRERVRRRRR